MENHTNQNQEQKKPSRKSTYVRVIAWVLCALMLASCATLALSMIFQFIGA